MMASVKFLETLFFFLIVLLCVHVYVCVCVCVVLYIQNAIDCEKSLPACNGTLLFV